MEGRFNGGVIASPVWGAYIWRGLYIEGLIFGILRYFPHSTFHHGRGSLLEKGYEITGENDEEYDFKNVKKLF